MTFHAATSETTPDGDLPSYSYFIYIRINMKKMLTALFTIIPVVSLVISSSSSANGSTTIYCPYMIKCDIAHAHGDLDKCVPWPEDNNFTYKYKDDDRIPLGIHYYYFFSVEMVGIGQKHPDAECLYDFWGDGDRARAIRLKKKLRDSDDNTFLIEVDTETPGIPLPKTGWDSKFLPPICTPNPSIGGDLSKECPLLKSIL